MKKSFRLCTNVFFIGTCFLKQTSFCHSIEQRKRGRRLNLSRSARDASLCTNEGEYKNFRLRCLRGGAGPIEYNPNYTLGDLEREHFNARNNQGGKKNTIFDTTNTNNGFNPQQQQFANENNFFQDSPSSSSPYYQNMRRRSSSPVPSLTQVISNYLTNLKRHSPTLFYGVTSSIIIFLAWQIQPFTGFLQRHFVCSATNVFRYKRLHTLILSTISHGSFTHLFMNMYGFITFGSSVRTILQHAKGGYAGRGFPLWSFCLGAALFGNIFFLITQPQGGCFGLSGVVLALLALDSKVYPDKEIGFVVRFIPIRLPAQHALTCFLALSVLGVVLSIGDGIAHSVHLGGLIFGLLYFEALKSGLLAKAGYKYNRFVYGMKKRIPSSSF